MAFYRWTHKLLSVVILLGLLLSPVQSLAVVGQRAAIQAAAVGRVDNSSYEVSTTGLYRTRVAVRQPADWARLERLGVVVLRTADVQKDTDQLHPESASFCQSAVILVDEDQLETLARLRFEPQGTDELGMLVTAHAQAKPWLAFLIPRHLRTTVREE